MSSEQCTQREREHIPPRDIFWKWQVWSFGVGSRIFLISFLSLSLTLSLTPSFFWLVAWMKPWMCTVKCESLFAIWIYCFLIIVSFSHLSLPFSAMVDYLLKTNFSATMCRIKINARQKQVFFLLFFFLCFFCSLLLAKKSWKFIENAKGEQRGRGGNTVSNIFCCTLVLYDVWKASNFSTNQALRTIQLDTLASNLCDSVEKLWNSIKFNLILRKNKKTNCNTFLMEINFNRMPTSTSSS